MDIIISLLAIYALAFLIKQSDGPWGIMAWLRNKITLNQYVGVFFFKLLDCYFCLGFHCGWIVYLLHEPTWKWQFIILWGLAGSAISLIMDAILMRLHRE